MYEFLICGWERDGVHVLLSKQANNAWKQIIDSRRSVPPSRILLWLLWTKTLPWECIGAVFIANWNIISFIYNAAAQAVCKQTKRECKTPTAIYTYLKGGGEQQKREEGRERIFFFFSQKLGCSFTPWRRGLQMTDPPPWPHTKQTQNELRVPILTIL